MKFVQLLTIFSIITILWGCGGEDSKLDPPWNGVNQRYSPYKKPKNHNLDPQIKVNDDMLREMAEHLFILQENSSEELKISEGFSFGATLLHYMGQFGNYTLGAKDISKLITGFENLIEKPIDEKIMFVVKQIKTLRFQKLSGNRCKITVQGKDKNGIVYIINQDVADENSAAKKIRFFQAKNGSSIVLTPVNSVRGREELLNFVKDTGKRDSIHPDIPRYLEDYFDLESPSPIVKMQFDKMIVRVLTDTIWKNIDFRFQYGWSIPLFRVNDKKIPGIVFYLKKNLAKTKISLDQ